MNSPVIYTPNWLPDADTSFTKLWNELDWVRHDKVPRREYYCNVYNEPYTYGMAPYSRTYQPQNVHLEIRRIWLLLEMAGLSFDVCFLNGYENQSDQLGWHSDNSPEMDDNRPIAIVSLGVEREIWFRKTPTREETVAGEVEKLKLGHGSLCLMQPGMQDTHQHRIPKASFICGERISLTFRGYVK